MFRIPKHIGIFPDGNRRWAKKSGLKKEEGYAFGLEPAACIEYGYIGYVALVPLGYDLILDPEIFS